MRRHFNHNEHNRKDWRKKYTPNEVQVRVSNNGFYSPLKIINKGANQIARSSSSEDYILSFELLTLKNVHRKTQSEEKVTIILMFNQSVVMLAVTLNAVSVC